METARRLDPGAEEQPDRAPLQLVYEAQTDPARWLADLWSYVEVTEEDTGA